MALIKCPECGREVSDKAATCIHCGTPLKFEMSVKIKILRFATGMASQNASEAVVAIDGRPVWRGFSGQVATFEVPTEKKCVITILHAYTGHPMPFFRDFSVEGIVKPGKKYEMKNAKSGFSSVMFGDPTSASWVLSEVDVIDSGF